MCKRNKRKLYSQITMSIYIMTVQNRQTGERSLCTAYDDFFGPREYGYAIEGNKQVLTQEEFDASWQNILPRASEIFDTGLNQTFKEAIDAFKRKPERYKYTSLRSDCTVAKSVYVSQHCNVDLDAEGYPVGIESF